MMPANFPSVSVLLPCHNEEQLLPRQLLAVVPQLLPCDELVLLDDGSTDRTLEIMHAYARRQDLVVHNAEPGGVNNAFNTCFRLSRCDFVLGASGNDELLPGAIAAWRRAAIRFPQARLIMGRRAPNSTEQNPWEWAHHGEKAATFYSAADLRKKWVEWRGHHIHGCSTFLRREAWGRGYSAGQWLADWWLIWQAAARYGIVHIPEEISRMSESGYSANHNDDAKYNLAIAEIIREAESPACTDIADAIAFYQDKTCAFSPRVPFIWFERGLK